MEEKDWLDEAVEELARRERQANLCYWELATTGKEEAQRAYVAAVKDVQRLLADRQRFARLQELAADGGPRARMAEVLRRQALPYQGSESLREEIAEREAEVERAFATFRAEVQGRLVADNDIDRILREENDVSLRREAWLASRQVGAACAEQVRRLWHLRNRQAQEVGARDFYALSLATQELDEGWLLALLGDLERRSEGAYAAVKAEVDEALAARFGVAASELMPWHYGDRFFQEAPSLGQEEDLDGLYAGRDLPALATSFFAGLGFDVRPVLARSDLFERPGKNQHAFCLDVDRQGDVRILCNLRPTERSASTLLHELGHAVYDLGVDPSLPYPVRTYAHLATTEAVALLFGGQTQTPAWLRGPLGLGEGEARALAGRLAALRRRGQLVFLRWALVVCAFEREGYRDPDQDLDALWWEKVARYQGLCRPPQTPAGSWAAKIHVAAYPVYYQNYILGEVLAAQLRDALPEEGGLLGRPEAGAWLRERLFVPGAGRPWLELVERALGRPFGVDSLVRSWT